MEELKECPFCGGNDIRIKQGKPCDFLYVKCISCGVSSYLYEDKKEAIKAWNTRNKKYIHKSKLLSAKELDEVISKWDCSEPYNDLAKALLKAQQEKINNPD